MENPAFPPETLIIDRTWSTCNACGKGAFPHQKSHLKLAGYGVDTDGPACGVEWKYVASNYVGLNMEERCKEMRPDLEWKGYEGTYGVH